MNIYSIKEIVKATNKLLNPEPKEKIDKIVKKSVEKLPIDTENIIREAERALIVEKKNEQELKLPLILKNEIPDIDTLNSSNYTIKLKEKIKEHMVNELYAFLKKKIKKNTLKLIIDQQVAIKNLENRINFLRVNENKLIKSYQKFKDSYAIILENNKVLEINNNNLQNNLDRVIKNKEQLDIENKELKLNLDQSILKNRSFEINSSELKKTISRYIINYKKLQEETNLLRNLKNTNPENDDSKIEFYQSENVRLSSELLSAQNINKAIKENFKNIQSEKEKISNKIQELNKAIGRSKPSNLVPTSFTKEIPAIKEITTIKEIPTEAKKDIEKLTNSEQKNLDEVISKIFAKV
tara:strand:- start:2174 stop:3232 length:1059 start_codon:yes stop_codon:yes gene_type:complete